MFELRTFRLHASNLGSQGHEGVALLVDTLAELFALGHQLNVFGHEIILSF